MRLEFANLAHISKARCGAPAFVMMSLCVAMQAQNDGGGRDVRVAMFTTQAVKTVEISGAGPDAWTARCATCAHEPLRAPRMVQAPMDVWAGGAVRVRDVASHTERVATGLWHVRATVSAFDVLLTLPSERYVEAVLAGETSPQEPQESLRAMAVVARTFALNGVHYKAPAGHLAADECDSTACQAMRLGAGRSDAAEAVRATAGETLWFGQRRAEVFFGQSCGGVTEDARAVWPTLRHVPYLASHADPFCVRHDPAKWHAEVTLAELASVAQAEGWKLPAVIRSVEVSERSVSGRALQLRLGDARVAAASLRMGVGRALGWNRVRSDLYDVRLRGTTIVFDGRGGGHGVGLCQTGATEMAREGKSAAEILAFYFPGTRVGVNASDAGWREEIVGAVRVRSTAVLSDAERKAIAAAWEEAGRRFAVQGAISPELLWAPSTEMFRQMTAQPGWMLASTRGVRTVLQPRAVLVANQAELQRLLLHEFLHVLVESVSADRAPLWLREGLVEMLAGEHGDGVRMSDAELVHGLSVSASMMESDRAHRAAEVRVEGLVKRYGLGNVRGWLKSGVPQGEKL